MGPWAGSGAGKLRRGELARLSAWALAACWLAILAGCGATYSATMTGESVAPPPDAFSCARVEADELGYDLFSLDRRGHRFVARKERPGVQRSDPTFRRAFDELTVELVGEDGGAAIELVARTFHEYFTRRGATLAEREASEEARAAGRAILEACRVPSERPASGRR